MDANTITQDVTPEEGRSTARRGPSDPQPNADQVGASDPASVARAPSTPDTRGETVTASEVLATVERYFPRLGLAVDCALSVAATLLLKDNTNPVAVIYVGGPSSSKTTVA